MCFQLTDVLMIGIFDSTETGIATKWHSCAQCHDLFCPQFQVSITASKRKTVIQMPVEKKIWIKAPAGTLYGSEGESELKCQSS